MAKKVKNLPIGEITQCSDILDVDTAIVKSSLYNRVINGGMKLLAVILVQIYGHLTHFLECAYV